MNESALRLFIGVEVSIDCANLLRKVAADLGETISAASWVAPSRYHVTLKYLGWTAPEVVFAIRDRVAPLLAGRREFRFVVRGLGAFPSAEKARVLWAGIHESGALGEIASELDEELESLGFAREKRPFAPHVTLARLREVADLTPAVVGSEQEYSTCRVQSVCLYESTVNSDGSGYPVKVRWELKPAKRQRSDLEQRDT